jgi:hypothetical protein
MSFYYNDDIEVVVDNFSANEDPSQIPNLEKKKFKQSFIDEIIKVNNCQFEWHDVNNSNILGTTNILEIKGIIESTADYTHLVNEDEAFKHFHIVDLVRPEIVIGVFSGDYATNSLYLEESDGIAQYLGLDMEGYIKMLIATKGFYCWQFALLEYKSCKEGHSVKQLKEHLPRLFPEVNINEVFALYDSLYISEEMVPGAE